MSKKEVVLSVVLGVALVSAISAAIGLIVNAFSLIVDYADLYNHEYLYQYAIGFLELGAVLIVFGLFAAICAVKSKRGMLSVILACVMPVFSILTIVILRLNVDGRYSYGEYYINQTDYNLFLAYVTAIVTFTVSVLISVVSYLMLAHDNKKPAQQNNGDSEQKSGDAGTAA